MITRSEYALDNMWNANQCGEYPGRFGHGQSSAWINNYWARVLKSIGSTAPWTWRAGHPLHRP